MRRPVFICRVILKKKYSKMESIILQAKHLKKEYRTDRDIQNLVIPDLDIAIKKGEFVVIMGNSGSGKSTLLYLLAGLEESSGGEVHVSGSPLPSGQKESALLRRTSMGIVFQQNNLVPNLTLLENILVTAYLVQRNRKQAKTKALELLKLLGLKELQDRYPAQVSGGEQQRCSIARALINDPDLLLADEPTGSLNASSTRNVLDTFASLHDQGQTIVMVTHELEAACYGERVVYLEDGKIIDELHLQRIEKKDGKEQVLLEWLINKGW
jgi:putative ABC transport system ATP-binding protein